MTDCTQGERRNQGLGRVRTAINLGFIIGPAAGGWLAGRLGQMLPAVLCVAIYCIDFFLVFFLLPESNKEAVSLRKSQEKQKRKVEKRWRISSEAEEEEERLEGDVGGEGGSGALNQLKVLWNMFIGRPTVGRLIAVKFLLHLSMAVGRSNYSLFVSEKFGVGPEVCWSNRIW